MGQRGNIRKAKSQKVWQEQRAGLRNVSKRGPAHVAIISGVGQFADADAVQDDPDDAFEWCHC
jgi:hypothetical protein